MEETKDRQIVQSSGRKRRKNYLARSYSESICDDFRSYSLPDIHNAASSLRAVMLSKVHKIDSTTNNGNLQIGRQQADDSECPDYEDELTPKAHPTLQFSLQKQASRPTGEPENLAGDGSSDPVDLDYLTLCKRKTIASPRKRNSFDDTSSEIMWIDPKDIDNPVFSGSVGRSITRRLDAKTRRLGVSRLSWGHQDACALSYSCIPSPATEQNSSLTSYINWADMELPRNRLSVMKDDSFDNLSRISVRGSIASLLHDNEFCTCSEKTQIKTGKNSTCIAVSGVTTSLSGASVSNNNLHTVAATELEEKSQIQKLTQRIQRLSTKDEQAHWEATCTNTCPIHKDGQLKD